jgi:iron complex transport system substrate-binding protein
MSLKTESRRNQRGRIVSFLPSSTEILYEIGAADQITGVTHECNYPEHARIKPRVINSSFEVANLTSKEIDNKIVDLMRSEQDIYLIDDQKLREAEPDLIIAQGVCDVCAPFTKEINRANSILGYEPELLVLDPHDLDDILINIMEIARRVGRVSEGHKLVASLQKRIDNIIEIVGERKKNKDIHAPSINNGNPRIVCIEWIDPFFIAGHWIPQMVNIAGGFNGLNNLRQPSHRISIEEIMQFNPDKIILMPCGFDIGRTLREAITLQNSAKWRSLQAVQGNEVYAVNANAYFSKPGPRTITGLEILAKIIDPEGFQKIYVPFKSFHRVTNG